MPTLSYEVKDGLILTISSINPDDGGESWVIINAKSNDKKSEKMAIFSDFLSLDFALIITQLSPPSSGLIEEIVKINPSLTSYDNVGKFFEYFFVDFLTS